MNNLLRLPRKTRKAGSLELSEINETRHTVDVLRQCGYIITGCPKCKYSALTGNHACPSCGTIALSVVPAGGAA